MDGWADGDIADFDVVGLFDGEGDGAGDGFLDDTDAALKLVNLQLAGLLAAAGDEE